MNWFNNMKVRSKILLLVTMMAILLGCVGYTGYYFNTNAARDMASMYNDRMVPSELLFDSLVHGRAMQANLFALMITEDEKENQHLRSDIQHRADQVDANLESFSKNDLSQTEQERFRNVRKELGAYRPILAGTMELAMANENQEAYDYFVREGLPVFERYQAAVRSLSDYSRDAARMVHERNDRAAAFATLVILALSLSAVTLALLLGLFIARRIATPLRTVVTLAGRARDGDLTIGREEFGISTLDEMGMMADALAEMVAKQREAMRSIASAAEKVGATAEEFSAVAQESNAGVEESRAGVDDVSSQMESLSAAAEEINASVEEVASGAQSAAQKGTDMAGEVEQARVAGEEGTKDVEKVVKSIDGVASEAVRSAQEVKSLGDRAREIQSFVVQIGGIADQTNLLALNAAIEAARAGEAGRGFAVVAEEVRKLAEDSNVAAKEIATLAAGITKDLDRVVSSSEKSAKESQESSTLAGETRATIGKMMESLSRIASATQDLAAVSEEQAASSEEIASAVQNIASRVSGAAASSDMVRGQMKEVASAAERVAQGSEELAALSVELRKLTGAFKFEGGERTGLVPVKSAEEIGFAKGKNAELRG